MSPIYTDEMATSTSVALTYTGMTGSPYSPLMNGKLKAIRLVVAGDAVTSLVEMVVVKLTNPKWGVPLIVSTTGNNLRTAPAQNIPMVEQECDLPVQLGSQIVIEVKHETAATPVTPRISIIGIFEGT